MIHKLRVTRDKSLHRCVSHAVGSVSDFGAETESRGTGNLHVR